jgi:hypothetical protein
MFQLSYKPWSGPQSRFTVFLSASSVSFRSTFAFPNKMNPTDKNKFNFSIEQH